MRENCAHCRSVLVVEDEGTLRLPLHDFLESRGARVTSVANGTDGIAELTRRQYDIVLTDIRMPGADGFAVLQRALELWPHTAVVLITAYADIASSVKAIRMGAYDYLPKPFSFDQLDALLTRYCRERQLVVERDELREELAPKHDSNDIVACSRPMQAVLETVRRVAVSDASVVLLGETGTGKELVADALHRLSRRSHQRIIKVNCAAIPDSLLESELFGHERGAFTGAIARKRGRFEMADRGTLFLDEIGDLSAAGQAKVLRALQEKAFERVGGVDTIKVDVRVIAASHRDLAAMVKDGAFREDLFYRLAVITLEIPPLRDRPEDVEPLALRLAARAAVQLRRPVPTLAPELLRRLRAYRFPGNVRELANLIERAATLCEGDTLEIRHFPPEVTANLPMATRSDEGGSADGFLPLAEAAARFEAAHIAEALRRTGDRRGEAAQLLGVSRKTLWARLHDDDTEKPT